MRMPFQIASVVVAALLAAQPALSGTFCGAGTPPTGGCAPDCSMAMSERQMSQMAPDQMGSDCSMPAQISSDECAQNCCHDILAQSPAQPVSAAKSNLDTALYFVPDAQMLAAAPPAFQDESRIVSDSAPPPRYILFQVFRI